MLCALGILVATDTTVYESDLCFFLVRAPLNACTITVCSRRVYFCKSLLLYQTRISASPCRLTFKVWTDKHGVNYGFKFHFSVVFISVNFPEKNGVANSLHQTGFNFRKFSKVSKSVFWEMGGAGRRHRKEIIAPLQKNPCQTILVSSICNPMKRILDPVSGICHLGLFDTGSLAALPSTFSLATHRLVCFQLVVTMH